MPVFRLFLMSGDQYLSNVSHVNLKSKDRFYCHAAWIAEKLVDWYSMTMRLEYCDGTLTWFVYCKPLNCSVDA